jgi:hypothetical protein
MNEHLLADETEKDPIEYDLHGTEGPVVLSVHAGLAGVFATTLDEVAGGPAVRK